MVLYLLQSQAIVNVQHASAIYIKHVKLDVSKRNNEADIKNKPV